MSRIDDLLEEATSKGRVAGVAAAAATGSGPCYEGAFGRLNATETGELRTDSLFRIASMTKAVTSVAVMQLVERGRLELDGDAGEVLPELAQPQVLEGFDASGEPRLRPAAGPITIRQLLTHTSGLAYEMWSPEIVRYQQVRGVPSILAGGPGFLDVPLIDDPGARWCYGVGTDRLGQIVERVSGVRLDAYFREHVLDPLGMRDTGFAVAEADRGRVASVHARQEDGTLAPMPFEPPAEGGFLSGGGGLVSTAPDYLRFVRAILGGGALDGVRVLGPESVEQMTRNQIGPLRHEVMRTTNPVLSNDVDLFPGVEKKWGLGFMINTEPIEGGRSAGSLAWAGIFNSYYWIDPARSACGVLLTQTLPFVDREVLALLGDFERAVYDSL